MWCTSVWYDDISNPEDEKIDEIAFGCLLHYTCLILNYKY